MEKGKKVEKKEEKKVTKHTETNNIVLTDEIKKTIRVVSLIISFFAVVIAIFTFVFSIITSLKVANTSKLEIVKDNFTVTFVSNLNAISIEETENIIQGYGSKALFIIFDIVLPAIAVIAIAIIAIILAKKLLDFISDVKREKDLFTKVKLVALEEIACLLQTTITISFIMFSKPSLIIYIITSSLVFIVVGLFKKCVELKNNR